MEREFTFKEIYSMSPAERKEKRVSVEIREDSNGNRIATWAQKFGNELIINQAGFDDSGHFTEMVGMSSKVIIKDLGLITDLYIPTRSIR